MAIEIERGEGQFTVGSRPASHIIGRIIEFGNIFVTVHSSTRTIDVEDENGQSIGVLIGTPIDTDRREILSGAQRISTVGGADAFMQRQLDRLAGSYLLILDWNDCQRIYLDANGTKSLVFDAEKRMAGATTQSILNEEEYETRFDRALYEALGVEQDGWFSAGLTAHRGVERLMCNHFLDLNTWKAVRHWPTGALQSDSSPDLALKTIADEVTRSIAALAGDRPTHVSLTAGNETRLLLACCRDLIDKVDFFTVDAPGGQMDMAIAKRLASQFNLRHTILPYKRATAEEAGRWQERVGHNLTGANLRMHPTMEPFFDHYYVGGLGGEVGRGFLWLDASHDTMIGAGEIIDRLKLPRLPELLARVEKWCAELRVDDPLLLLDIAYIELRMSSWAYAQSYANPRVEAHHPLTSRYNFNAMLSLPAVGRRNNGMILKIVEQRWPELLNIPINRYGDWRDRFSNVRKAIREPGRAFRKLKQLSRR